MCKRTCGLATLCVLIIIVRLFEDHAPHVISLSHAQNHGVNADLAWKFSRKLEDRFPLVELAHGGDDMRFHHYGTNDDYSKMLQDTPKDAMLNAMAYMTSMVKWVCRQAIRYID